MVLLFALLALVRGVVYAALIPPWQSPDEHGHFEYAWLVSQYGPLVGPEAISPEFQQRVLESMYQFDYWRLVHQPTPEDPPAGLRDPEDPWLRMSGPQVGDERPLYYWLVGGLLRLAGDPGVVVSLYIGRAVSVLLTAAAVGVAALATGSLFPRSPFMQIVPPAFLLTLPMLGQMGAAVSSDGVGVLTGTIFFASLIPAFRDGLTWRRAGGVVVALALALLSKKTALFMVPTALLALLVYGWTRGVRLSRRMRWGLASGAGLLVVIGMVLALVPGGDATGWLESASGCGPTRLEGEALEGEAALRVGACQDGRVSQALPPETVATVAGQTVTLNGWVRGATGPAIGRVAVWDSESHSQAEVMATEEWRSFALTHTVDLQARRVAVRLERVESMGPLLFDGLALSGRGIEELLLNGSAEQERSKLVVLLSSITGDLVGRRRLVEAVLLPQSWSLRAWQGYARGALFCLGSFLGIFGWVALPQPSAWYRVAGTALLLAMVGDIAYLVRRPGRRWVAGYLAALMGGVILLGVQTLLPMVDMQGTYWLPQGRYLFPGMFAFAVLFAWGLHTLVPSRWERWTTPTVAGLLLGYDLLCLGFLIGPYFYGR